jgi:hypothetical protein
MFCVIFFIEVKISASLLLNEFLMQKRLHHFLMKQKRLQRLRIFEVNFLLQKYVYFKMM